MILKQHLFEIDTITPRITVFGLSFMILFSATLVAKDRESAFLQRLYTTPLRGIEFILGYMFPILPIALGQGLLCGSLLGVKQVGGMHVIYQIERLPLMVAISIHGGVLYISYLVTYLLNDWLEKDATPILFFSGIFIYIC